MDHKIKLLRLLANKRHFAPSLLVLLGAIIAVGAYMQAFNYPFIFDDNDYIVGNKKLAGLSLFELWRLIVEPYNPFDEFLPLRDFSYWLDQTLFGLNPSAFRMHNIFLYVLCLPLVFGVTSWFWRYFRPADAASAPLAAAVVTALFALNPAHVEAVVWVASRKDVLSGVFSLLALWLAVNARREKGLSVPFAAATLIALALAILSKATAIAVAPLVAMLWVFFWRDIPTPRNHRILLLWPLAALLLAACLALTFTAFTKETVPLYFGIEAATRSLAVLGWLARLAVSPESRHIFYPVFEDSYLSAMVALGVAVLVAAVIGTVVMLRKRSLNGFALFGFFILCGPSLQLIPYAPPSLVSDRFVFLAAWTAIMLLVSLSWHLKPIPRTVLLLGIALSWGFQTMERPHEFRNFEALVDADISAYPGFYMPVVYKIVGTQLPQQFYRDAIETANSITAPEFRAIMIEMIMVDNAVHVQAIASGEPQEAVNLLIQLGREIKKLPVQSKWNTIISNVWKKRRIILKREWNFLARQFPGDALVRYNVGLSMLVLHDKDAATHLRAAIELQSLPESMRGAAFRNYGLALLDNKQVEEAEIPLRAALEQLPPDFRAYCLLSYVYKQTNRIEEAARAEAECQSRVQ